MGRAIDYCTVCGDQIPAADVEKGKAIEAGEGKVYCVKCRAQAPAVAAAPSNGKKRTGSTGTFPAIRPMTGRLPNVGSGGTQRLPATGPGTTRLPHVTDDGPAEVEKSKMPLIAGGVAGVVLLGAIILFFAQSSADNAARAAEQKKKDAARAAYEEVVKYDQEHPEDADGLLKLIAQNQSKVKGTEFSGKLTYQLEQAETKKKKLDLKKARTGRLEALRGQVSGAKDLVPVIEEIDKFQKEMAAPDGDPDLVKQALALGRSAREKRILNAIEETKNFQVQNPDKYDEAIDKWAAVQMLCEPGFESFAKIAQEGLTTTRSKQDEATRSDWDATKTRVENLRKQKKWADCQKEIQDFTSRWKRGPVVEEATKLAWDIDKESKDATATTGNTSKPDPAKVPPKDWTALFDDKNQGGWLTGGTKMKWESVGGVMVGTNTLSEADAAADASFHGVGFWYTGKLYAGYEAQIDFTLTKGEAMLLVGISGVSADSPPGIPIRTRENGNQAQVIVGADKPYTMTVQVTGDTISINGAGLTGGKWNFQGAGDGKDHGAGAFGFVLYPGSEIKIRNVKIRAIP